VRPRSHRQRRTGEGKKRRGEGESGGTGFLTVSNLCPIRLANKKGGKKGERGGDPSQSCGLQTYRNLYQAASANSEERPAGKKKKKKEEGKDGRADALFVPLLP